ncbi:MAG: 30S ribosomal protein S16 [Planctomycetaceae bacterium]|nr:30S ribosomal protein S16 [Planctomycetaceae bacterium]
MAVKIRMKMLGRKHRPFFRICAIDSRKSRDSDPIEELGTYDPMVANKSDRVKMNLERVDYWLSVGAIPSDRVKTLIKKVKTNKFGEAKAPPAAVEPKPLPVPAAAEEAASESAESEAAAETTEETTEA